MEKLYRDYDWNIQQAVMWFRYIGKNKRAEAFWAAHLKIAEDIRQEFYRTYRT